MKRIFFLLIFCLPIGRAQTARDLFSASLDKFVRQHEQIRSEDIYAQARAAFAQSPDEVRKRVDAWLESLPPVSKAQGYAIVSEFGKAATIEEVDSALRERPQSSRLFMQGLTPEDIVWLALSQVESLNLRKERQSYQIARVYLRPRVELISRSGSEVRLAIYDFDSLVELTTTQASAGVLCPTAFRVSKKEPNQASEPTAPSGRGSL